MILTHSVVVKRNFISEEERAALLEYGRSGEAAWEPTQPGDSWHLRLVPHQRAREDIKDLLRRIRSRTLSTVSASFSLKQPLYADGLALVRWREGDWQGVHADRENPGGQPHPYPWRDYGTIIYLNDDFEGGELFFPTVDLRPKIEPGMLAFFPGNLKHAHGVTKVTKGVRYTVASFLTHDVRQKDWE